MMAPSGCGKWIIPLAEILARQILALINLPEKFISLGSEQESVFEEKTGAEQLCFIKNIPNSFLSAHFLGLLGRV